MLKKALSESKTNLGNLEHLATLKSDVSLFKSSSASQGERLKNSIDELNENMTKSIAVLENMEKRSLTRVAINILSSIKTLFTSKK